VFGSSGGFSANLNLSTSTAAMALRLTASTPDRQAGQSVQQAMSMAMALMTSLLSFCRSQRSSSWLCVFGSSGGFSANLNKHSQRHGFKINAHRRI